MTFDFTEYIRAELFVLVPVLYALGVVCKKSPLKDWMIPFLLCGAGALLCFAYFAGCGETFGRIVFASITQGVLCAACSVLANNLVKQFSQRKCDTDETESEETGKA